MNWTLRPNLLQTLAIVPAALLMALVSTSAYAQSGEAGCGRLFNQGQYGPYDYRRDKNKLGIVEGAHFTPVVEALIRGNTSLNPGGDIDYTLRAFPNHHRALLSMMAFGEKMKSDKPRGADYTVECYFDRAIRFRPDDTIVKMIYATFLVKKARLPEAIQQLERAITLAGDNAFTHFNIGLVYFDLKEYDRALVQAHKAMALGSPQTTLRDQLKSVNKWAEPSEAKVETAKTAPAGESAGATAAVPDASAPKAASP